MALGETDEKEKRKMRSFEADDDVDEMLDQAQGDGLAITEICNTALRDHGPEAIRKLLRQKTRAMERWENVHPQRDNLILNDRPAAKPPESPKPKRGKGVQRKAGLKDELS